MPDGRVLIAFDSEALDGTPTWERIDDTPNLVAGIDIHRGRQTEFDFTDTSTAVVYLNDTTGLFDPQNTSSPYYGKLDGKQIMLQLWNPVTSAWVTQFRGHIDNYGYQLHPSQVISNVQVECVDIFDYLSRVEMLPGSMGYPLPASNRNYSRGTVFYEETDWQTRITDLLGAPGANLPSEWYDGNIFTGNVDVQDTLYDPGDSILVALRDAADAEFPGVANVYTNKAGEVCAHGRMARFRPETTSSGTDWDFTRWPAGDGDNIGVLGLTLAQIRPPVRWSRPRSRIINAAIAYPFTANGRTRATPGEAFTELDIPDQIVIDAASIADFGYRAWSARDLIVSAGTTTMFNAAQECYLFASYYVANYSVARTRLDALTFKSVDPDYPGAAAIWGLITGCDISDLVELDMEYVVGSGTGLHEDLYIEGLDMTIRPLQGDDFDMVELSLNVTPKSYYDDNVFS